MSSTLLYLDPECNPSPSDVFSSTNIVRSLQEARMWVNINGIPSFISFAYDLHSAEQFTGADFAEYLVKRVDEGKLAFPHNFNYTVHRGTISEQNIIFDILKDIKR